MSTPHTVPIRPAIRADTDALVALWDALLGEHEALDARFRRAEDAERRWRTDLAEWLRDADHRVVLVELRGEAIGFAHAYRHVPPPLYASCAEVFVESLYVRPEARRHGAARALVGEVRMWAEAGGAERLRVGTLAQNAAAAAFWQAEGAAPFEVVWTLPLTPHAAPSKPRRKLGF